MVHHGLVMSGISTYTYQIAATSGIWTYFRTSSGLRNTAWWEGRSFLNFFTQMASQICKWTGGHGSSAASLRYGEIVRSRAVTLTIPYWILTIHSTSIESQFCHSYPPKSRHRPSIMPDQPITSQHIATKSHQHPLRESHSGLFIFS